jgi:NAD(P)H-nitrite reductase large subunit
MPTHHVIVGGGPAATNAVETIREFDGQSQITLVCDEPAHSRMALPYWLAAKIPREDTYTADDTYFQRLGVATRIGVRVTKVDPQANLLTLSDGSPLSFDKLLIATGSSPLAPPIAGVDLPGVQPLWSLAHTEQALQASAGIEQPRVVMVGAGFIGFIVLNAMFKRGWKLAVVERESRVLPRMLDEGAADFVERWLASKHVAVHAGTSVQAIRQADDGSKLVELANGQQISADLVILATGIRPNLESIDAAGIQTDQGILVNDRMQTNFPHIYAAGDVAQGPVLFSDQRAIHAIQPTAVDHGRVAGANMAGHEVHYPGSLLMNVVDVCGLQCASFGNWNDASAEAMTISNPGGYVYRKLLWRGDQIVGSIFTGQSNDLGMLTDVGMVKGILQTQTPLGPWKQFLEENPFDIRRAYIASGVAKRLVNTTLLGRPTRTRQYRLRDARPTVPAIPAHAVFVGTKPD